MRTYIHVPFEIHNSGGNSMLGKYTNGSNQIRGIATVRVVCEE